jgi:putative endonuclease
VSRAYGPAIGQTARQILGSTGERLTLEHYERLGFELLARNHRTPSGELDLVVSDGRTIVFVEVKTARADTLDPVDSLTRRKLRRLRRAAGEWLATQPRRRSLRELRFDAVAVVIDAKGRLVALEQFEGIDCPG